MTDRLNRTELHYAAADQDESLVKKLLKGGLWKPGADPNAVDDQGWVPLHFAAQSYHAGITKKLLHAGAEVDPRDCFGKTPLHVAVMNSLERGDVIRLLLDAGADPHAENNYGISPIKLANEIANYDIKQFFA